MKAFENWEVRQPRYIYPFADAKSIQLESRKEGWKAALEWALKQKESVGVFDQEYTMIDTIIIENELEEE